MAELSYSRGPRTALLDMTLSEALERTAARFPNRDGLISRHQNRRFSWRELDESVTRVARGLAGLGLEPGDRVGIWSANCAEWILLQYACARAGFVLVNVNPAYRSHELAFVLRRSGMRAIFLWSRDERAHYDEILETACPPYQLRHVIRLGTPEWESMLAQGRNLPASAVSPADITNIQYTSGTTGSPKGVLLTHRSLVNNAWFTGECLAMTEQDRLCIPFPLYHCAGSVCCALNCVTRGAAMIFPSPTFDAKAALEAIQEERATMIAGVPTMFLAELQHPEFPRFDLSSLRVAYMGGASCPVELLREVNARMQCREVAVIYGQTEAAPVITMHGREDNFEQRTSTVGIAMPNTEVKIVNPVSGEIVSRGEMGELCARGYLVMAGYDQEPEATAQTIDAEGWLHTGDLAAMREDGRVNIRGRARDVIIRGGENIYPAEVESFLHGHPKIADVHVVGLPDRKFGETVAAWIRLAPGETATAQEIRHYCDGKIAHFKIPQHVRFVDMFPMTVTGKVQKFRIREIEIEEQGLKDHLTQTA